MDTGFDVHASVPAEVWTLGQLNAQKANLINTMEAAKSRVFNSNQQIRLSHQEPIDLFIILSFAYPIFSYSYSFFLIRTSSVMP